MSDRRKPSDYIGAGKDRLHMRLFSFQMITLQHWGVRNMLSPFWRLYCNLDDGAWIDASGQRWPLQARQVYLVPAWLSWSGETTPGVRHIFAHFDLPELTCSVSRKAFPVPLRITPDAQADRNVLDLDLAAQFEKLAMLVTEKIAPDPLSIAWSKSLVYWSLRIAFEQVPPEIRSLCLTSSSGENVLIPLLNHLELHLNDALTVDALADLIPCSRAHLTRLFQKHLGVAPMQFVTERRISRAAELLLHSDESIESIAERCGFPNRNYFTRIFANTIGFPPVRYRKMGR